MDFKELLKVSIPVSIVFYVLWIVSVYLAGSWGGGYRGALDLALLSAPLTSMFFLSRKKKTDGEVITGMIISFLFVLLLWIPFGLFGY